jgi:putative DNA methylase
VTGDHEGREERRLIEQALPVRTISFEATREKLLRRRDYHISMLHLWWARRPLAAARAAVFATLVGEGEWTGDPERLAAYFKALCAWGGSRGSPEAPVADARRRVLATFDGNPPKVLDCFAGGGAIPLEIGRLGGDAVAVELNPVAYLILQCTLVYPQRYGPSLAEEISHWGEWIVARAIGRIGDLYPALPDGGANPQLTLDGSAAASSSGAVPVAYLWSRTVPCPNPALPDHELDLVRQTWLVKKPSKNGTGGRFVALRPIVEAGSYSLRYDVADARIEAALEFDPGEGSERGDASCRVCGTSVTADDVKALGRSGHIGRRLMAAVTVRPGKRGKQYHSSTAAQVLVPDDEQLRSRLLETIERTGLTVPTTPLTEEDPRSIWAPLYGLRSVGELFTYRQLISLLTFCSLVREAHQAMLVEGIEPERAKAIATFLAMAVDRVADRNSTLCHWDNSAEKTANTFARQALPMVWDFSETNPFSSSSGSLGIAFEQVAKVARHCADAGRPATVIRGSATDPVPGGPFDAVITDPPYYDNIPYSDLSDFFYAWLQRSIGHLYPEHLSGPTAPKRKEIVAVPYRHGGSATDARHAYDDWMAEVFAQRRKELKPGAPLVVVYAHKTYAGWATLINALRRAGFVVVEAWPLDTEMPTRSSGQGTASLASSIFLVARRREQEGVGNWSSDVYPELQSIVAERVAALPTMGVSGDDLVIATIGAGLRAYTQYQSVQLPNGDDLGPEQYLEEVQREVVETILADVFGLERSGMRAVDPMTQFYVMGRFEFGTGWVEFDRANTLAHGVGVETSGPRSVLRATRAILEQERGQVRFRDYVTRGAIEGMGEASEGGPAPLIDILHRLLYLAETAPHRVRDFIVTAGVDPDRLRVVAQALSGVALTRKGVGTTGVEQTAISNLLVAWKRLVDENLLWLRV